MKIQARSSMKNIIKNSSWIYLALFYVLNIIYIVIEIYKSKLALVFNTNAVESQKEIFDKMLNCSNVTTSIENVLVGINLVFLIISWTMDRHRSWEMDKLKRKDYSHVKQYLVINIIGLGSIKLISLIVKDIYAEQIIIPVYITFIAFVAYLIPMSYRLITKK